MTEQKEGYRQAVRNFREQYQHELVATIEVLIEIRDAKASGPKNRSDAAYRIARMLGGLQIDRVEPTNEVGFALEENELTDEEQAEMEDFLGKGA